MLIWIFLIKLINLHLMVSLYKYIYSPSIIKSNLITCLECMLNPINWKYNPYC